GRLVLTGGSQIRTTTLGEGAAGTITVNATERGAISGGGAPEHLSPSVRGNASSALASSTQGEGAAGRIVVRTPLLEIADLGAIAAQSLGSGVAGDVTLEVGRLAITSGGF